MQVNGYINERKRQISVVNTFYLQTLNKNTPQLGRFVSADIPKAILTEEFVFILFVNILPDLEIDNFDNYNPNHSDKKWFNNLSIVGEIR